MQAKAQLYDIEVFGKESQFNKAVFLDADTMDKVGCMVNESESRVLRPLVGKSGVLVLGLVPKGYDYSVKFKEFKVAS